MAVVKLWRGGCTIDVSPHTNERGRKYIGSRGGNTRKVVEIAHTHCQTDSQVCIVFGSGANAAVVGMTLTIESLEKSKEGQDAAPVFAC